MRASEIMTKDPACCIRTTSVMNAAGVMREFNIGILLVIEDLADRKLMGVVTDRDLCLRALGELHDPTLTTVEDCMATEPVTCTLDTDVGQVLATMTERQIRRVPVVDDARRVQGIVGIADFIRHNAVDFRDLCIALSHIMAAKPGARARAA